MAINNWPWLSALTLTMLGVLLQGGAGAVHGCVPAAARPCWAVILGITCVCALLQVSYGHLPLI